MRPILIDARDATAPQIRGWGRYTRELVQSLLAGGAGELEIIALTGGGRAPEICFEQLRLPALARRRAAGIVHAPNCFLPLVRPCPGVVTINDLAFEVWPGDFGRVTGAKFRWLTRLAAGSAERIICPSRFTADDVCARYGVDPGKVRVIPDAPALAMAGRAGPAGPAGIAGPAGRAGIAGIAGVAGVAGGARIAGPAGHAGIAGPYVLAVGDLRAKKNLRALVQAFVALRARDGLAHELVLAGVDGGEGARLLAAAGDAPVRLTGYVDDAALDALLRGADLLVHPSLYEGFGLVVLEAMARGVPVLATRATALPETGGDAAAYFDPGDADDLRRRLGELLGDGAARARLAALGPARAAQFSWERTARATADVYRELL